jgi:hypothetical protein
MPEGVQPDANYDNILRPLALLIEEKGNLFQPFECPSFSYTITLPFSISAADPISLFKLYFSIIIME